MLKMAIPEFSSEHGSQTLNSEGESTVSWKFINSTSNPLTLGILRYRSHGIDGDCGRFQDRLIGGGEPVKVVRVLLGARRPRKVHVAHLGRDGGQIMVDIGVLQVRRHSAIVDGVNLNRVAAELFY